MVHVTKSRPIFFFFFFVPNIQPATIVITLNTWLLLEMDIMVTGLANQEIRSFRDRFGHDGLASMTEHRSMDLDPVQSEI